MTKRRPQERPRPDRDRPADDLETADGLGDDPLSGSAYGQIRKAIQTGNLKPGTRITESKIAGWLSMSRTPVREALFRLEAEGLLTRQPRLGLTVTKLNYQAVVELYAMRAVLEGTAARFAAHHASEAEVETLRNIVQKERAAPPPNETTTTAAAAATAARLNRQFHHILYQAAHNRYLLESLKALSNAMALLGNTTLALPGRHAEALDEHQTIIDAVQAKDGDAAELAARSHIQAAQRNRLKMLLEQSDAED